MSFVFAGQERDICELVHNEMVLSMLPRSLPVSSYSETLGHLRFRRRKGLNCYVLHNFENAQKYGTFFFFFLYKLTFSKHFTVYFVISLFFKYRFYNSIKLFAANSKKMDMDEIVTVLQERLADNFGSDDDDIVVEQLRVR